ncbi:aconitase X catalytic domain-containing protein [soil metagenome]
MSLKLTERDLDLLAGGQGEGAALAMRIMVGTAEAMGAGEMLDIVSAHVDGCLHHGAVSLDFAQRLIDGGARVTIPTTLNVGSVDLLHPELFRGSAEAAREGAAVMGAYERLGCEPTYTCAPYQLRQRPGFGEQIAWAESNAIVFANSVLGARTERYGDFTDICAAVTGRAPAVGLHTDAGRRAHLVIHLDVGQDVLAEDAAYPALGHLLGSVAGSTVAALLGLPPTTTEDRLKAMGAAAASSGPVGMFHAVGVTPEAPDLPAVLGGHDIREVTVDETRLRQASRELSTVPGGPVDAVCLGTPHYSTDQLRRLAQLLGGRQCELPLFVNTGRETLENLDEATVGALEGAGATLVVDTCTYITPILHPALNTVMTDSAKWAYYAPANLGVEVVYASVEACVATATGEEQAQSW